MDIFLKIDKSAGSRIATLADNTTVPGDCSDRVTSQNGNRVIFERLAIPRPPPTVTLKSYLQTQQQQQQQEDDTQSVWKQRATWESRAGVRDDTKHATEGRATRQLVLPTSEAKDDTHHTVKEELTDTNTKDIERIKVGFKKIVFENTLRRRRWCSAKNPAKPFSTWGNVGLIELKKSTIQCPSCLHYVLEVTFLCNCGKLLKLDPDAINRIKEAFEIVKAPFRASHISTRGAKCGPNPWQLHHDKARDAFRGATKGERGFTSIWDRWQNDAAYRDAWFRNLNHIVQFRIFHNAPQQQRERNLCVLYLRSADENRQALPPSQRPGYREAKEHSRNFQNEKREQLAHFIPESEGNSYVTRLIFHCKSTLSG